MKKVCIFFIGILYFVCLCAQSFKYENIAVHPRLLWPLGGSEAIKEAMAEYPQLASVHERILRECTAMFFQNVFWRGSAYWEYLAWRLNVFFIFHMHIV